MDNEKLIKLVFERECLWNTKNKNYHNREISKLKWQEISEQMNKTLEAVKTKWRGLRDTYRKELYKYSQKQLAEGGEVVIREPTWPYYNELKFLEDQCSSKYLDSNTADVFECYDENTNSNDDDDIYNNHDDIDNSTSRHRREKLYANKKTGLILPRSRFFEFPQVPHITPNLNEDGDFLFLLSLLPSLRKVADERKMLMRIKLQQAFYDEETYQREYTMSKTQDSYIERNKKVNCNNGCSEKKASTNQDSSLSQASNEEGSRNQTMNDDSSSRPSTSRQTIRIAPISPSPQHIDTMRTDLEDEDQPRRSHSRKASVENGGTISSKRLRLDEVYEPASPTCSASNSSSYRDVDTDVELKLTFCNEILLCSGKYFRILERFPTNLKKTAKPGGILAECHICRTRIKGYLRISSNFLTHLKTKHPTAYLEFQEEKSQGATPVLDIKIEDVDFENAHI